MCRTEVGSHCLIIDLVQLESGAYRTIEHFSMQKKQITQRLRWRSLAADSAGVKTKLE